MFRKIKLYGTITLLFTTIILLKRYLEQCSKYYVIGYILQLIVILSMKFYYSLGVSYFTLFILEIIFSIVLFNYIFIKTKAFRTIYILEFWQKILIGLFVVLFAEIISTVPKEIYEQIQNTFNTKENLIAETFIEKDMEKLPENIEPTEFLPEVVVESLLDTFNVENNLIEIGAEAMKAAEQLAKFEEIAAEKVLQAIANGSDVTEVLEDWSKTAKKAREAAQEILSSEEISESTNSKIDNDSVKQSTKAAYLAKATKLLYDIGANAKKISKILTSVQPEENTESEVVPVDYDNGPDLPKNYLASLIEKLHIIKQTVADAQKAYGNQQLHGNVARFSNGQRVRDHFKERYDDAVAEKDRIVAAIDHYIYIYSFERYQREVNSINKQSNKSNVPVNPVESDNVVRQPEVSVPEDTSPVTNPPQVSFNLDISPRPIPTVPFEVDVSSVSDENSSLDQADSVYYSAESDKDDTFSSEVSEVVENTYTAAAAAAATAASRSVVPPPAPPQS